MYISLLQMTVLSYSMQGCRNIEPTAGHIDLLSPLLSRYFVYINLPDIRLDLSDNVLHDWLFPHHCSMLINLDILPLCELDLSL